MIVAGHDMTSPYLPRRAVVCDAAVASQQLENNLVSKLVGSPRWYCFKHHRRDVHCLLSRAQLCPVTQSSLPSVSSSCDEVRSGGEDE